MRAKFGDSRCKSNTSQKPLTKFFYSNRPLSLNTVFLQDDTYTINESVTTLSFTKAISFTGRIVYISPLRFSTQLIN